jgi:hypothetical protein
MSFRKNWLPNLVTSILQLLVGALIYKQQVQPWVENLLSMPRGFLMRAIGLAAGVSALLFGLLHARAVLALMGRICERASLPIRRGRGDLIPRELRAYQDTVATLTTKVIRAPVALSPEAGSITLAGHAPILSVGSPTPQFITNSSGRMYEQAVHQQHMDALAAMQSTMRRTPPSGSVVLG